MHFYCNLLQKLRQNQTKTNWRKFVVINNFLTKKLFIFPRLIQYGRSKVSFNNTILQLGAMQFIVVAHCIISIRQDVICVVHNAIRTAVSIMAKVLA